MFMLGSFLHAHYGAFGLDKRFDTLLAFRLVALLVLVALSVRY